MLSDLIESVTRLRDAFDEGDFLRIKQTSKACIERSALASDKTFAKIAIIAYSLGKLASKEHIADNADWPKIKEHIVKVLKDSIKKLRTRNIKGFNSDIEELTKSVLAIDETFGNYLLNVYDKAKVKMASSAYGFGLSLSQASELTDADKKDVLEYIGRTKMHDEEGVTLSIQQRLKGIRKLLQ